MAGHIRSQSAHPGRDEIAFPSTRKMAFTVRARRFGYRTGNRNSADHHFPRCYSRPTLAPAPCRRVRWQTDRPRVRKRDSRFRVEGRGSLMIQCPDTPRLTKMVRVGRFASRPRKYARTAQVRSGVICDGRIGTSFAVLNFEWRSRFAFVRWSRASPAIILGAVFRLWPPIVGPGNLRGSATIPH